MLLGIISDSHDNLPKIDAAVENLNASGVDLVLQVIIVHHLQHSDSEG